MMALNRYRLQHLARKRHRGAMRAARLLKRPERLIGLILLGNNLVNILAAATATVIGLRLLGDAGIALATGVLTVVILIFAELFPKTVAALYPERVAFPASWVLEPLLRLTRPLVALVNIVTNALMRLLRLRRRPADAASAPLGPEELHFLVREASGLITHHHRSMLLNILELEQVTVNEIMVPRNEVAVLRLEQTPAEIQNALRRCRYTRLPVCRGSLDQVVGILHSRQLPRLYAESEESLQERLAELVEEPYYIPEGTSLHAQLVHFQRSRERVGLVVDEYGMVQGLVTLEDILEEIVGEFTFPAQAMGRELRRQSDGSCLVDGALSIRELNRRMQWQLPMGDAHTVNGLILEHLGSIPGAGTSLRIGSYAMEITQSSANAVKVVKIEDLGREDADREENREEDGEDGPATEGPPPAAG